MVDQEAVLAVDRVMVVAITRHQLPFQQQPSSNNSSGGGYVAPDGPVGVDVTCPDGRRITNGVKVTVVQMRTGFDYTATAVGINGFDPVLAVLDPQGRAALCNDDERNAANYSADLPTTGYVPPR